MALLIAAAFLVLSAGLLAWSGLYVSGTNGSESHATTQPEVTSPVGTDTTTICEQGPGRPEEVAVDNGPESDINSDVDKEPQEEPPTDQMTDEEAIQTGFFFNAGEYVAPPYKITVDRDGVKINGILVRGATKHPKAPPTPEVDPGPFQWTAELEAKGMHKSGFVKHAVMRFSYWERHYPWDEACKRFEGYLKQQPLVVKVYEGGDGDFAIRYQTKDGEDDGFGFSRLRPKRTEDTIRSESLSLQQHAESLRQTLVSGGAFFFARGRIYMPSSRVKDFLPHIYEILVSKDPAQDKAASLVERGLLPRSDAQTLVDGFTDDLSLRKRIEELEGVAFSEADE